LDFIDLHFIIMISSSMLFHFGKDPSDC